jgi:hypothetical protein
MQCECGCGAPTPMQTRGVAPRRFLHGHSGGSVGRYRGGVRLCSRRTCDLDAFKRRTNAVYCARHYRFAQMRSDSVKRGKAVPSFEQLEALAESASASGQLTCPSCSRAMVWLSTMGDRSSVVSLQHDHSGEMRLICMSCNARHHYLPNDAWYAVPDGSKACSKCGAIKPFDSFQRDKSKVTGRIAQCRECRSRKAA